MRGRGQLAGAFRRDIRIAGTGEKPSRLAQMV
jgi:hypothetical protein